MNDSKFCPLMKSAHYCYCSEKCGWYNEADKCCSMVVLSNAAINVAEMAVGQRIIYTKEI